MVVSCRFPKCWHHLVVVLNKLVLNVVLLEINRPFTCGSLLVVTRHILLVSLAHLYLRKEILGQRVLCLAHFIQNFQFARICVQIILIVLLSLSSELLLLS